MTSGWLSHCFRITLREGRILPLYESFKAIQIYWSSISCEYQLSYSTKPLLTTGLCVHQKWWEMKKFQSSDEKYREFWLMLCIMIWGTLEEGKFEKRCQTKEFCSTSSRRKPGWRFTAGSTYSSFSKSNDSWGGSILPSRRVMTRRVTRRAYSCNP